MVEAWPGSPVPLGATWDGAGTNFALYSEHAERVELCLFDHPDAAVETARVNFALCENGVWHAYLPGIRPGQLYGYRVHGPYAPDRGHRFNPAKLLLDPYAKAISGPVVAHPEAFGYTLGNPREDLAWDPRNSAGRLPKCVVVEDAFTWDDDKPPRTPLNRTVIYECHVKGLTAQHPLVPPELRGTYLGLCSEPVLEHLGYLGVTAVELLPIHHPMTERHLLEKGLANYWGYSSIGFFAPDGRYASIPGRQVYEFKTMVRRLHQAGIEVILDVVYNHTGEGNHLGPTVCFRGIDNSTYYWHQPHNRRYYADYTGCGNTLQINHPRVLQLVMDSLRYWVQEMHVDGFRFDLASALARGKNGRFGEGTFFHVIQQDPVLARVKLIAEPWDLGEGGYMVGNYPPGWGEWNGKFRDTVRRWWRGDEGHLPELAYRLSGSSDLYGGSRSPSASVNYVTCHDGFTLHDLVSYEQKHNLANGEENRDGTNENYARNWGVEGPTEDHVIVALRERMKRNFLATLALSQGVPMLSMGDELGRSQQGNNNAYCQDGPLSWVDWHLDARRGELLAFTRRILALRRAQPVLRRRSHFAGVPVTTVGDKDLAWLRPDGSEMQQDDWARPSQQAVGMLIHGNATDERDERGQRLCGDTLLLLMNAGGSFQHFRLPVMDTPGGWTLLLNTARPTEQRVAEPLEPYGGLTLPAHSLLVLSYGPPC